MTGDEDNPVRIVRLSYEDIESARVAMDVAAKLHFVRIPDDDDDVEGGEPMTPVEPDEPTPDPEPTPEDE